MKRRGDAQEKRKTHVSRSRRGRNPQDPEDPDQPQPTPELEHIAAFSSPLYKCPYCSQEFKSYKLVDHVLTQHLNENPNVVGTDARSNSSEYCEERNSTVAQRVRSERR
jgi:hypothetical protein